MKALDVWIKAHTYTCFE